MLQLGSHRVGSQRVSLFLKRLLGDHDNSFLIVHDHLASQRLWVFFFVLCLRFVLGVMIQLNELQLSFGEWGGQKKIILASDLNKNFLYFFSLNFLNIESI